jgi:hypothetical protein
MCPGCFRRHVMFVAYWTADHEALLSPVSGPTIAKRGGKRA